MAHRVVSLLSNDTSSIGSTADSGKPPARRVYGLPTVTAALAKMTA